MTATNKERVLAMWKAFSSRDPDAIGAYLAEDALWVAPPDNPTAKFLGERGGMAGRSEIVDFVVGKFRKVFAQDVSLIFKGVYADGDVVVVELAFTATLANGRPYKNDYCFVHIVRDGKVVEVREFMDTYNGHRMMYGAEATI
jgi:ketosteroid isomerase-like protein